MKAKIKKTGEVIEVSQIEDIITKRGVEHQYVDNKRSWCYYVQSELEFIKEEPHKTIDWEQRRYEIAKTVIHGQLTSPIIPGVDPNPSITDLAKWSVNIANALIAELKKGGE